MINNYRNRREKVGNKHNRKHSGRYMNSGKGREIEG